jgi:hypothetical protein
MTDLKIYVCTDHDGHWPVGVCSVIVAFTEESAREMLKDELRDHGLDPEKPFTLRQLNLTNPKAFVLLDGEY